jgi:hypothetical protein
MGRVETAGRCFDSLLFASRFRCSLRFTGADFVPALPVCFSQMSIGFGKVLILIPGDEFHGLVERCYRLCHAVKLQEHHSPSVKIISPMSRGGDQGLLYELLGLVNVAVLFQVDQTEVVVNISVFGLQRNSLFVGRLGGFVVPAPKRKITEKKQGGNGLWIGLDRGLVLLRCKISLALGFIDPAEFDVLLGAEGIVQNDDPRYRTGIAKDDHGGDKKKNRRASYP